jgi:hypothetical protein
MTDIIPNNVEVKIKKPMSESLKRAQAKYYQKIKHNIDYPDKNRDRVKKHYDKNKDDPEFRKKHNDKNIKHKEKYKDDPIKKEKKIKDVDAYNEKQRENYYKKKLKNTIEQIEKLGIEKIAELLIETKKVKILTSCNLE